MREKIRDSLEVDSNCDSAVNDFLIFKQLSKTCPARFLSYVDAVVLIRPGIKNTKENKYMNFWKFWFILMSIMLFSIIVYFGWECYDLLKPPCNSAQIKQEFVDNTLIFNGVVEYGNSLKKEFYLKNGWMTYKFCVNNGRNYVNSGMESGKVHMYIMILFHKLDYEEIESYEGAIYFVREFNIGWSQGIVYSPKQPIPAFTKHLYIEPITGDWYYFRD
jgi:hypothetical protein